MRHIFIILSLFFSCHLKASEGQKLLEKVQKKYAELGDVKTTLSYVMYRGYSGNEIVESYNSQNLFYQGSVYRKMKDVEFYSSDSLSIQVNHRDKIIIVSKNRYSGLLDANLANSLKSCKDVRVEQLDNGKLLSLIIKEKTDLPFNKVDVLIKEDFSIDYFTLFYASKFNFSNDYRKPDFDFTRLKVYYGEMTKLKPKEVNDLSLSKFISFNSQDSQFKPSSTLHDFELIDLRQ